MFIGPELRELKEGFSPAYCKDRYGYVKVRDTYVKAVSLGLFGDSREVLPPQAHESILHCTPVQSPVPGAEQQPSDSVLSGTSNAAERALVQSKDNSGQTITRWNIYAGIDY